MLKSLKSLNSLKNYDNSSFKQPNSGSKEQFITLKPTNHITHIDEEESFDNYFQSSNSKKNVTLNSNFSGSVKSGSVYTQEMFITESGATMGTIKTLSETNQSYKTDTANFKMIHKTNTSSNFHIKVERCVTFSNDSASSFSLQHSNSKHKHYKSFQL